MLITLALYSNSWSPRCNQLVPGPPRERRPWNPPPRATRDTHARVGHRVPDTAYQCTGHPILDAILQARQARTVHFINFVLWFLHTSRSGFLMDDSTLNEYVGNRVPSIVFKPAWRCLMRYFKLDRCGTYTLFPL